MPLDSKYEALLSYTIFLRLALYSSSKCCSSGTTYQTTCISNTYNLNMQQMDRPPSPLDWHLSSPLFSILFNMHIPRVSCYGMLLVAHLEDYPCKVMEKLERDVVMFEEKWENVLDSVHPSSLNTS